MERSDYAHSATWSSKALGRIRLSDVVAKKVQAEKREAAGECREIQKSFDGPFVKALGAGAEGGVERYAW